MERSTGKVIYARPNFEAHERYELSVTNNMQYFDESGAALQRLSKDVARDLVTSILENFLSPEQFLQRVQKAPPAPVYLFLGPEVYQLSACRRALVEKVLAPRRS